MEGQDCGAPLRSLVTDATDVRLQLGVHTSAQARAGRWAAGTRTASVLTGPGKAAPRHPFFFVVAGSSLDQDARPAKNQKAGPSLCTWLALCLAGFGCIQGQKNLRIMPRRPGTHIHNHAIRMMLFIRAILRFCFVLLLFFK